MATDTLSTDDVAALAYRLHIAGNTARRVDWEELQQDLLVASRLILTLIQRGVIYDGISFGEGEGRP